MMTANKAFLNNDGKFEIYDIFADKSLDNDALEVISSYGDYLYIVNSYGVIRAVYKNTDLTTRELRTVPKIKRVIFNNPATIVLWEDGTKTVVKKQKTDRKKKFDKEKGLALAIAKKALGNQGRYFEDIKKWVD